MIFSTQNVQNLKGKHFFLEGAPWVSSAAPAGPSLAPGAARWPSLGSGAVHRRIRATTGGTACTLQEVTTQLTCNPVVPGQLRLPSRDALLPDLSARSASQDRRAQGEQEHGQLGERVVPQFHLPKKPPLSAPQPRGTASRLSTGLAPWPPSCPRGPGGLGSGQGRCHSPTPLPSPRRAG